MIGIKRNDSDGDNSRLAEKGSESCCQRRGHSSVARAFDCRSRVLRLKSGCFLFYVWRVAEKIRDHPSLGNVSPQHEYLFNRDDPHVAVRCPIYITGNDSGDDDGRLADTRWKSCCCRRGYRSVAGYSTADREVPVSYAGAPFLMFREYQKESVIIPLQRNLSLQYMRLLSRDDTHACTNENDSDDDDDRFTEKARKSCCQRWRYSSVAGDLTGN
ncbi:unnamed protein product [Enterobius vermicularis]|uniref:Uncharacterized protein n=1 Tax=Enterobius vermicularis TaxID=51028 RepID=A0A0N4VI88_ENTVE|nr:unnamed protein product [Enterobius vermicularis]